MVHRWNTCGIKLKQWLIVQTQHTLIHCKHTLSVKVIIEYYTKETINWNCDSAGK